MQAGDQAPNPLLSRSRAPRHSKITQVTLKAFRCVGGGIGGGSVLVPLFILVWQFQTEHAVALSNLTIAAGAFANLWCNFSRYAVLLLAPRTIRVTLQSRS